MKEYDRVELLVEKENYANEGVHKGMDGLICAPRNIHGQWLVCFDHADELPEYPIIAVKEADLYNKKQRSYIIYNTKKSPC